MWIHLLEAVLNGLCLFTPPFILIAAAAFTRWSFDSVASRTGSGRFRNRKWRLHLLNLPHRNGRRD